jgi:hypothetical protein
MTKEEEAEEFADISQKEEEAEEFADISQRVLVRFAFDSDGCIRCKACETQWAINKNETLLLLALAARAHYKTCLGDFKP